ncbi:Amino acid permeases signature [Nakaseomyces glabratus]|nr:Amino acid permeases signature [Nakaseomyces glabratus]
MPKNPLKKQYWTEVIDGFHSPDRTDSANDRSSSPDNFELSSVNSPVRVNVSSSGNDDILKGDTKEYPRDVKATPEAASYVEDINNTNLNKDLSVRHLLTLAVGGAIGTGLFVNSGASLTTGGPASLVIGWVIVSTCLFTVINSLGELAAAFPVVGGFNVYITRFIEPSFAFAINLNYLAQWLVLLPLELVAASITIRYWNDKINSDAWVAIFYTAIALANMLDVKSFGETEFILSMVKILAIIGFGILGIVLTCGGGPHGGYIGGKYWHNPGAFVGHSAGSQFKGLCSVFVTAAFSYSGIEMTAVSAAESRNPKETIPKAAKRTFWLITVSYVGILTLIGCLVPYNDQRLLNGSSSVDAAASPLVIAIENGGIKGLPSLMNAIILIAIVSVANSAVYACSRCMVSMAHIGNLPKFLSKVDKRGRPLNAILLTLFFGLLSFIAASDKQEEVFTWLSALSGLSTIFCWMAINLSLIRFRDAMKAQGRSLDEMPFLSQSGTWGAWYGVIVLFLVLVASFWTSLFPVGSSTASAKSFFEGYLSLPILIACYVGHKLWKRDWRLLVPLMEMDLDSGRRVLDAETREEELRVEREYLANASFFTRFLHIWC